MFLCDIHSHSKISHDSKAELFDTAQAAIDAGLQEFCVTDHCDLLGLEGEPVTGFDWPAARAQFRAVKAELGDRLTLRLGLELGSAVSDPDEARAVLAQGGDELDFVLGSIHNWIGMEGNLDFYFSDFHDNLALARRAVESTLDHTWTLAAKLPDCYDSLAHNVCRGKDIAPWPPLLRWFRECGGRLVTVGSDAHRPEDVAKGIPQALDMVRAAGFDGVATFAGRKPILHKF